MTPVQIPFKRNFKDMENKFEYLKIDGRGQLPAPWSDYPVLREYETVTVYRNGRDYLDALWDSRTAGGLSAFTWRWAVPAVVSTRDVNGDSLPPVRMPFCGHSAGCSATRNCGVPHGRPYLTELTISGN